MAERRSETVVITGAGAGVGRAAARTFAAHGARLGLLGRGRERLEAAASEVEALGGEAVVHPVDVSDAAGVEEAAAEVERRLGPVDVWVNNAMTSVFSYFLDVAPEDFRRVTEVTYLGCVHGTLAALKRMIPRDRGCVVQVGSALSDRSIPLQSAYCGAKHAIRGFTDSIRSELLHRKSRVHLTMVQLPAMNTPQFDWVKSTLPRRPQPVPPIFEPEVGAEAIYFAAHRRRREVYVGLPTVEAMWGNKLFPGLLDRFLAAKGVEGQQTDAPDDHRRPFNLWEPVQGDVAARGSFGDRARPRSYQFWASRHKALLGTAAALAAGWAFGRR